MEIYLVRHTEVDLKKDVCYGFSDVDLKPDYMDHFELISKKLPNTSDLPVYSSPLKRCKLLAEHIGGREIIYDDRLKELNFGSWELKSWSEIGHSKLKTWGDDYVNLPAENGESFGNLSHRTIKAWNDILAKQHDTFILVGHGGVIRSIISHLLEMDLKNAFRVNIDYGGITKISIKDESIKLQYINQ
jgi:alpha-ribazole phosphatase